MWRARRIARRRGSEGGRTDEDEQGWLPRRKNSISTTPYAYLHTPSSLPSSLPPSPTPNQTAAVTHKDQWLYYSSIGFSGVIFTLAVLESHSSPPNATRSVMGMFSVPSRAYPWVLLILIQLMLPHISFVGHLSGLLVGILQSYGCIAFLFPSASLINKLEGSSACACLARFPQYVLCPDQADHILPRGVDMLQCCAWMSSRSSSPRRFTGSGVSGTVAGNAAAAAATAAGPSSLPTTVQNSGSNSTVAAVGGPAQASPTRMGGRGMGGWSRLGEGGGNGGGGGEEEVEIVYDGHQNGSPPRQIVL